MKIAESFKPFLKALWAALPLDMEVEVRIS